MKTNYQKNTGIVCLVLTVCLVLSFSPLLFGPGLDSSKPVGAYLNGVFPNRTPTGSADTNVSYTVENAFPNLTFTDPVDMVELPGADAFLVLGLQGQIWRISNDKTTGSKQLLMDISDNVVSDADGGMLGMALHPEYGQAGSPNSEFIYVFYRYTPVQGTDQSGPVVNGYMRLSRFNLPTGANAINPSSEQVLINIFDRHDWHNGGDMFFGSEDGFLYLAIGDEGAAYDSYGVTQQIDKWLFGGVLRIDVDKRGGSVSHPIRKQPLNAGIPPSGWPDSFTQGYFIPNDNPWVDASGRNLEEFYAMGTRSPHRMTQDPTTGLIWIGDIGQGSKEEISVVRKGDNLQWPYREGDQSGRVARPDPIIGNDRPPIHSYGRNTGRAIIGGMVYRGNRYPELRGHYVFGDHETQDIWKLTQTGENTSEVDFLLTVPVNGVGNKDGISSFFTDSDGFIYILDLFGTGLDGGVIHKIVRSGSVLDPPDRLSELNVFTDLGKLTPIEGIIPYDVNAPLWSDGAEKRRWLALPNDGSHNTSAEQIDFENEENWSFPPGTVAIKQFDLPTDENDPSKTVKLETRFLVFTEDDDAYAVTYKWNDEQTDAFLIGINESVSQNYKVKKKDGSTVEQTWNFPTRAQCVQCHNSVAGYALGLKTRQLNKSLTYPSTGITGNQLETWNHLNMFSSEIGSPKKLPASAGIDSDKASDEMKVRSYMDANCAFCHRPNGVEGAFDGRAMTALYDQNMINSDVASRASIPGHKIVRPKDALNSMLYVRDASTGDDRMPPIGRNELDEEYLKTLIGWIDGLEVEGPNTVEEGEYIFQMGNREKYLIVTDASNSANAQVINSASSQGDEAKWDVKHMGGGKYRITAKHSNMVLSLRDLRSGRGARVVQEPWNGEQHQLWYFKDFRNGNVRIVNAYNGLGVHISRGTRENNRPAVLWSLATSANQEWKLVPSGSGTDLTAIGETGNARANHTWTTVTLKKAYTDPVVIAGGASYAGNNQTTVRVKDVTSNSFKIRVDEWECLDEFHYVETIPYIVVESGIHELPNGKLMQAGTVQGMDDSWYALRFDREFATKPVVFGQCISENEAEAVNVRVDSKNNSETGVRMRLKEQDAATGSHVPERVSWLAVEPGTFAGNSSQFEFSATDRRVDHNWYTLSFNQEYPNSLVFIGEIGSHYGGDASAMRFSELTNRNVKVFIEEEKCGDTEKVHTKEEIHYIVFGRTGEINGKKLFSETEAVALKAEESNGDFYFGDVTAQRESHLIGIDWTASNDEDINTYSLERSVLGQNFAVISDQPSTRLRDRHKYSGYDYNPAIGSTVYRIAAITTEGEKFYSPSVEVKFESSGKRVLVYPNPIAKTQALTAEILVRNEAEEDITLSIFSNDGRLIRSRTRRMDRPQAFEQFAIGSLEEGMYILEVKGKGWKQSQKFIVRQ